MKKKQGDRRRTMKVSNQITASNKRTNNNKRQKEREREKRESREKEREHRAYYHSMFVSCC
jgi:hypothetical protein